MKRRKICFHCHTGRWCGPAPHSKLKALEICFPIAGCSWLHWADHSTSVVPLYECGLRFCSFLLWLAQYVAELSAARRWGSSAAVRQHYRPAQLPCAGGEWGIPGGLEGTAERQPGCGSLCPEQEWPDKQQRSSWQSWEVTLWSTLRSWRITWFISVLRHKGYTGSCEQKDAPFAGTLLSSTCLLPEHNSGVSVAGKVAKNTAVSAKLIAAHLGEGVAGVSTAQSHRERTLCKKMQGQALLLQVGRWALAAERIGLGRGVGWWQYLYRISDFSDAQLGISPLFSLVWWKKC